MKKLISLLLTLLMLLSVAFAEGENTLLRYAVELGKTLDAMPLSEELVEYINRDKDVRALADDIGKGNRNTPTKVVAMEYRDLGEANLQEYFPDSPEQEKRSILDKNLPFMLMVELVGETIGSFTAQVTFSAPDVTGQGLWVLYYEDALPVVVAWYAENGAVHMEGSIFAKRGVLELYVAAEYSIAFRTIAAARPALDTAVSQLADEYQTLARSETYLDAMNWNSEFYDYAAPEGTAPRLILCALTEGTTPVNQEIKRSIHRDEYEIIILRYTMTFADADASGEGLYVLLYDSGMPVVITWKGENGAYFLSAIFCPGDLAQCRNVNQVNAWAQSIGLNANFQTPGAMLLP